MLPEIQHKYCRRLFASAVAALALSFAVPLQRADAVTFDFVALANFVTEGTWDANIGAGGHSVGGVTVFASASNYNGSLTSFAYLDGSNAVTGDKAGLGVCSFVGGACTGNSDDNVGRARDADGNGLEKLTLTFNQQVKLTQLLFNNRDHRLFNGTLGINGTAGASIFSVSGGLLSAAALAILSSGTVFDFYSLAGTSRIYRDFYLSGASVSPVPLPPAALLFGSVLAGAGLLMRRRKTQATA